MIQGLLVYACSVPVCMLVTLILRILTKEHVKTTTHPLKQSWFSHDLTCQHPASKSRLHSWSPLAQTGPLSHRETYLPAALLQTFLGVRLWHITSVHKLKKKTKLRGLGLQANYTDWETADCWQSYCQLLQIEGATWSVWRIPAAVFSDF
jgi:hypothetical protein